MDRKAALRGHVSTPLERDLKSTVGKYCFPVKSYS